jgi:hypothetical protein
VVSHPELASAVGEDEIVADRPGFGESASAVAPGRFQVETGTAWIRANSDSSAIDLPEPLVRVGVLRGLEVRALLPNWTHVTTGDVGATWADVSVGLKAHASLGGNDFSVRGTVYLPTGSPLATEDHVDPEGAVAWSRELSDQWSLGATVSAHRYRLLHETLVSPSLSLGRSLGSHAATFLEYGANVASGVFPAHKLDHGYTWLLNARTQLDASLGVALSRAAPDFFVGFGFCERF